MRQRAVAGVQVIHARHHAHDIGRDRQPVGAVAVQRQLDPWELGLERLDQRPGIGGVQQPGHVLDRQRVGTRVDHLAGELQEVLLVVDRADGVRQRGLGVAVVRLGRHDRRGQVPFVVERIEDPNPVRVRRQLVAGKHRLGPGGIKPPRRAGADGLLEEFADDVVGVRGVAEQVLPPAKRSHLYRAVGLVEAGPQLLEPQKRVVAGEPQRRVQHRTAPQLKDRIPAVTDQRQHPQ